MRTKLVVGNWKMNASRSANAALVAELLAAHGAWRCEVAVCPPAPYLAQLGELLAGSAIAWGAQDCSAHEPGAYTGEVAASMLAEFGCRYVIVGHSERRAMHAETDQVVADKAKTALAHQLTPIVCVGETLAQREAGETGQCRQAPAVGGHSHAGALHLAGRRRLRAGVGHRHRADGVARAGAGGARDAARAAPCRD